jgi:hypothetical protein
MELAFERVELKMQAVSDFSSVFSALSVSERKPYRSFMNNPG